MSTSYSLDPKLQLLFEQDMANSGIGLEEADYACIYPLPKCSLLDATFYDGPGTIIPYYDIHNNPVVYGQDKHFVRMRALGHLINKNPLVTKRAPKYLQPRGTGVYAYFPPVDNLDWLEVSENTAIPIIITEGEKKALKATLCGFPCVGLGGVWNWKIPGTKKLLPELDAFKWTGRTVYVIFDSDAAIKPEVRQARTELVVALREQYGAAARIVELPGSTGPKQGLDDVLVAEGGTAWLSNALESVPSTTHLEIMIEKFNALYAIITGSSDSRVFDKTTATDISRASFKEGHIASAAFVQLDEVGASLFGMLKKGRYPFAPLWLRSPSANRVFGSMVHPGEQDYFVDEQDRLMINRWKPIPMAKGDVSLFLQFDKLIMGYLPDDLKDHAMKYMAYKMQNPWVKIPYALFFFGNNAMAKSLWSECICAAFGPYSTKFSPRDIEKNFNSKIEGKLILQVEEVKQEQFQAAYEIFKDMVTSSRITIERKGIDAYDTQSFSQFIITGNYQEVAGTGYNDRRLFVIQAPHYMLKDDYKPLYRAIYKELEVNKYEFGKAIAYYLMNYDLAGWEPPGIAPMTVAKAEASDINRTEFERLLDDIKERGMEGLLDVIDSAKAYLGNPPANSRVDLVALNRLLSRIEIRPFYTSTEIALLFSYSIGQKDTGVIGRMITRAHVPRLRGGDVKGRFERHNKRAAYYVLHDYERFSGEYTQEEFEKLMEAHTFRKV